MNSANRIRLGLLGLLALLPLGACQQDLTSDPAYGFAPLAGRCFTARQDWYLKSSQHADFNVVLLQSGQMPKTADEYYNESAYYRDIGAYRIIGVLPAGSKVQIDSLKKNSDSGEGNPTYAVGEVLDGPLQGKTIELESVLKVAAGPRWEADDQFLKPCDISK